MPIPVVPPRLFLPSIAKDHDSAPNKSNKDTKVPVRVTCFEVLKIAGKNPWDFFGGFFGAGFTFFGRPVVTDQYIHIALASQLRALEDSEVASGESATEKGTSLGLSPGIYPITGSRVRPSSASVSMHLFGLATDIDYETNYYPDEGSDGRATLQKALESARTLLDPGASATAPPWAYPSLHTADSAHATNDVLKRYIQLQKDESAAALAELLSRNWLKSDGSPTTVSEAQSRIRTEIGDMFKSWRRQSPNPKDTGFLTIPKSFIEKARKFELHWGGEYGDYQHFDLRLGELGKSVRRAIDSYKSSVALHADLAAVWSERPRTEEEFRAAYPKS